MTRNLQIKDRQKCTYCKTITTVIEFSKRFFCCENCLEQGLGILKNDPPFGELNRVWNGYVQNIAKSITKTFKTETFKYDDKIDNPKCIKCNREFISSVTLGCVFCSQESKGIVCKDCCNCNKY